MEFYFSNGRGREEFKWKCIHFKETLFNTNGLPLVSGNKRSGNMEREMDPTAAAISDRDCDTREGETVAMNYKPSPLQVKLGKKTVGIVLQSRDFSKYAGEKPLLMDYPEISPSSDMVLTDKYSLSEVKGREGFSVNQMHANVPDLSGAKKQRELARKGSLKNGNMGSPVNQQPKKNNVMARTRLVVPNKGYSSLDQSPDEKPLVALDTDSDDDFDMSRYSSSGYSSAEQINQDLNIQLLKDGYRLDEIPDDEDLDLIPPKSVNPTCMCCQATSSTACHIQ
ncbi:protein FAM219A [Willisornis vidua]|uniref:Protein FAM219A n=1 Tax=Willisornis vidua TaxID=1566151 RepID=A0ABQ9DU19_9PASS|nr:protein FAM219A [Willisornis vidua]